MSKEFLYALLRRFGRAFVMGGFAAMLYVLQQNSGDVTTIADLKNIASMLAMAFVTGGLMAVEKLLRYKTEKDNGLV